MGSDRPFLQFGAFKSVARRSQTTWNSPISWSWGSKIVKGSVGKWRHVREWTDGTFNGRGEARRRGIWWKAASFKELKSKEENATEKMSPLFIRWQNQQLDKKVKEMQLSTQGRRRRWKRRYVEGGRDRRSFSVNKEMKKETLLFPDFLVWYPVFVYESLLPDERASERANGRR